VIERARRLLLAHFCGCHIGWDAALPLIRPESSGSIPRKRAYGPVGAVLRGFGPPGGVWNLCPHLGQGCLAPPRKPAAGSLAGVGRWVGAGKGQNAP
jgi:hypothetical protein